MKEKIFGLPLELYHNRGLILTLAKNDFKTKIRGILFGHCLGVYPANCYDHGVLVCLYCRIKSRRYGGISFCAVSDFRYCSLVRFFRMLSMQVPMG